MAVKIGMKYIYDMYFTIQMIAFIYYFTFSRPASAEIFIENLKKLVAFEDLKPEPLIRLWDEDFSFENLLSKNSWV